MTEIIRPTEQLLTAQQLSTLRSMFLQKLSLNQTTKGVWASVYEELYNYITNFSGINSAADGVDPQTWLWLRGARTINAGEGPFADLIRDYTIIQHRLRYGGDPTEAEMDGASNAIARNFLGQWLGWQEDTSSFPNPATQPNIRQAGLYDAGPAASMVFSEDNGGDGNAAGWAGTVLFANLGTGEFWRKLVLASMLDPTKKGEFSEESQAPGQPPQLQSADKGSYDTVAAAAAMQEWAASLAFFGALASPGWLGENWGEITSTYYAQNTYSETTSALAVETNAAFRALYGLDASGPNPSMGTDIFGFWSTATDLFKDAHYTIGTSGNDTIGYSVSANKAYATDSNFFQRLLGSTGLLENGDVINAGRGDDTVYGTTGSDILDGGEGANTLSYLPASWTGLLDRLYFSFDAAGKYDSRTIVDKWSLSGLVLGQDRDIAVQFDKILIDYRSKQVSDGNSPSGMKELINDKPNSPLITVDISGDSNKVDNEVARSEHVVIVGDLHKMRGANVYIDLGRSTSVAYNQDTIDASGVTHGVKIDLRNGRVKATDQWDISTASKLYVEHANQATGTQYDDVLIAASGERVLNQAGDPLPLGGFSVLYGGGGNDLLAGAGWESHLYGGAGNDTFNLGSSTWVEDASTKDRITYGIPLNGGVRTWWMEGNNAYWAAFSALTTAFPVAGAELLYTASFFMDQWTMKFARYKLDSEGNMLVDLWGQTAPSVIRDYHIDLDTVEATGGVVVFRSTAYSDETPAGHSREGFTKYINLALKAGFGVGLGKMDPLVLDIDGDGYELASEQNGTTYFEFDGDGYAEHTGWIKGGDGFLVRDVNANGTIDSVAELFGGGTTSGFTALAALDSSADGKIDASDTNFASLRVWRDANMDGVSQAGELKTLSELGIVSISLSSVAPAEAMLVGDNEIVREGTFVRADGTTGKIADVALAVNEMNSKYLGDATVSSTAAALPELTGFGVVKDLRVAMTQDGGLRTMVAAFVANTSNDLAALKTNAEAILFRWAGVDQAAATALGTDGFDTRKLAFLEAFSGYQLMPREGGTIDLDNLAQMDAMWGDQLQRLTLRLIVQGPLAGDFATIHYDAVRDMMIANSATALADLLHARLLALPSDATAAATQWEQWAPLLGALAEGMIRSDANEVHDDYLFAQLVRAMDGVPQPLTLTQLAAALDIENLRIGTASGETLARGTAEDTTVYFGAGGTDAITGGGGQDVYVFGRTIGHATITDIEPNPGGDRIRFAFLNPAEVSMRRDGNDLLITVTATSETIRVVSQFAPVVPLGSDVLLSSNKGIEDIQFADGTIFEMPEIMAAVGTGTSGADHMVGTMHSDVLIGGAGNDLLEGSDDADLYVFNRGDGADTIIDQQTTPLLRGGDLIVFGNGIAPEHLVLSRAGATGQDLVFSVSDGGGSVLVQNQFAYTSLGFNAPLALNSRVEVVAFRQYGEVWTFKNIQQRLIAEATTDGADTTRGFGDDDEFGASAGNDVMIGMDGADTYNWGTGSGNDIVREQALYIDVVVGLGGLSLTVRADTVQFSQDIRPQDLVFSRLTAAPDLLITNTVTGETLTVEKQFEGFQTGVLGAQWFDRVEWFQFGDGSRLSWQDVLLRITTGGAGADHLWGDVLSDTLAGGAGADTLTGFGGGDIYKFNVGDGHDTVQDGNTSLLGDGFVTIDATPDVLLFGAGITPGMITLARSGTNVDLIVGSGGDRVTLAGQNEYFHTGVFGALSYDRVEEVRFADGTVWTWQQLNQKVIAASTTGANDVAEGFAFADRFEKSAGDDLMSGGDSGDTYVFGVGAGRDTIRESVSNVLYGDDDAVEFDASVAPGDVTVSREGIDLVLTLTSGDSLRVEGEFDLQTFYTWTDVERFVFSNGTVWTKQDVQQRLLQGTAGDDHLVGFYTGDVLDGGAGNDLLEGREGGDVYKHGLGGGHDVISDFVAFFGSADDRLIFGPGIAPTDVTIRRSASNASDMVLSVLGGESSVTLKNQITGGREWTLDVVEFASGTTWTTADLANLLTSGAATSGDDTIDGTSGPDQISGGAGNDILRGGDGADTLDGGQGNDLLEGGNGDDTYAYALGGGQDTISDYAEYYGSYNILLLGNGIAPSAITFARSVADANDIELLVGGGGKVTLDNQLYGGREWGVDLVRFADGTEWTAAEVNTRFFASLTTSGADVIEGGGRDDILLGGGGNDVLRGSAGLDSLDGGSGDDRLEGGDGDDTYIYAAGSGNDVVSDYAEYYGSYNIVLLGGGILPGGVTLSRATGDVNDLVLSFAGGGSITLDNQFYAGREWGVDLVRFANGIEWDQASLATMFFAAQGGTGDDTIDGSGLADTLVGYAGNDILRGLVGNDTLTGGTGNDMLVGAEGDDTYNYALGDGNDTIVDYVEYYGSYNSLVFGAGITTANIRAWRSAADPSNLYISFANAAGSVLIEHQTWSDAGIQRFVFADGTMLNKAQFSALTQFAGGAVVLTSNADSILVPTDFVTLDAKAGDDILAVQGNGGGRILFRAGDGHDILRNPDDGYVRNDTLVLVSLNPVDVSLSRSGGQLLVTLKSTGDSFTVDSQFSSGGAEGLAAIEFGSGATWDRARIATEAIIVGTSGADSLELVGNFAGVDLGTGDDQLALRGNGSGRIMFGSGDGHDVLDNPDSGYQRNDVLVLTDLNPQDISIVRSGNNAISVNVDGTGDSFKALWQFYDGGQDYGIDVIEFMNGTTWDRAKIASEAVRLGTAGEDELSVSGNFGKVDLGAGNDYLAISGNGGGKILFGVGDGQDFIDNPGDGYHRTDILVLTDFTSNDVTVTRSGASLFVNSVATGDRVQVRWHYYDQDHFGIAAIQFSDGVIWDRATIDMHI